MSFLDSALALAAHRFLVFPIAPDSKRPAIRGWQGMATADERTIRGWWKKWPSANVGIHTKGLLVVDVDGPQGHASLERLRERYPLPETLKALSGNAEEGSHYQLIYALPEGVRAWNKPLCKYPGFGAFEKVDIRSTGGQVVGPGSRHRTGGFYRWADDASPEVTAAAEAPGWALHALCRPDAAPEPEGGLSHLTAQELFDSVVARFPVRGPGTRNDATAGASSWLIGKGVSEELALATLSRWLHHFAGEFLTPMESAKGELVDLLRRNYAKLRAGKMGPMRDHQSLSCETPLSATAERWFEDFCSGTKEGGQNIPADESTKRVLCSRAFDLSGKNLQTSPRERNFVRCLLVHVNYEAVTKRDVGLVQVTDRQIMAIHLRLFGSKLSLRRYYGLKRDFVTSKSQTGRLRRAKKFELMRVERVGTFGKASLCRLSGISQAFAGTSHQKRNP